jgi:hypothetical protein
VRSSEIGCCRVWCKDDPSAYLLHPRHYEALKAAWMRGEAFYEGDDCYGEEMVVKLGHVVVISLATPAAMALADADAEADKLTRGNE